MASSVTRITLFKVIKGEDVQPILDAYRLLPTNATKEGEPYILSCKANKILPEGRNQNYTLAAHTQFATLKDMEFYDRKCEAHAQIKALAMGKIEPPPLILVMEDELAFGEGVGEMEGDILYKTF